MTQNLTPKIVFLIGFMGCGKTTIGKHLARDLGWEFVDQDRYFERSHNCTITQFFAEHGEAAFRRAETETLEALAKGHNIVVATGGGAPCHDRNIDIMRRAGLTIYVRVEPSELAARLKTAKAERPLIANKTDGELLGYIESKLAEREPFYRRAHITADGATLPFETYQTFVRYGMPADYNRTDDASEVSDNCRQL